MLSKSPNSGQKNLFYTPLPDLLNPDHPLYLLAEEIDWEAMEIEFKQYYSHTGRPAHPVRLMVGLLILKQINNLGDETVVEKWVENPYYQNFCGVVTFQWSAPIEPSDLVHFRKRIGEKGAEYILRHSIELHGEAALEDEVIPDTSVQEKAIRYPTDSRMHERVIEYLWRIAESEGIKVKQSYRRMVPRWMIVQSRRRSKGQVKQSDKARRKLRTAAGRLMRDICRKLSEDQLLVHNERLAFLQSILDQRPGGEDHIYSVHAPEVACIAKGKVHPKYEFGSKVSIIITKTTNIIVGALNFQGNPYDGHTLEPALDQCEDLTDQRPRLAIGDLGYRGRRFIGGTEILHPGSSKKNLTPYQKRKRRERLKRRQAIEPIIGHLKSRFGLKRNWLNGTEGDQFNLYMATAAFNLKKWMNQQADLIFALIFNLIFSAPTKSNHFYTPKTRKLQLLCCRF
jgi:transposase, IS5 family